jgi:hypothetical protein
MQDATAGAINGLALDIKRLSQGLTLMLERQQEHGAMLAEILEHVAIEPSDEEESPVAVALRQLIAAVERLPEDIKRAVVEGLREVSAVSR